VPACPFADAQARTNLCRELSVITLDQFAPEKAGDASEDGPWTPPQPSATVAARGSRWRYTNGVATTTPKTWTDEELMALPDDGKYELVDGELIHVSPAGARHGDIVAELLVRVRVFAKQHKLGHVFDGQTGFRLPAGNLRSPDVSFVEAARLPEGIPAGFLHLPPDLAVEVLSPTDRAGDLAQKVGEYLGVGVRLVWVIDPEKGTAVAYEPGGTPYTVRKGDALQGRDVLPGFTCPLLDLLA
jgi:Uma2 family endonuclease